MQNVIVSRTSAWGLKLLRPFVRSGGWTYKIRQGVATGLKRKGGLGFIPKRPTLEEQFLLNLDWKGETIYDVGGYEGVFTLFFASAVGRSGRVFTFEPNPANCQKIVENVQINGLANVQLLPIGLGSAPGKSKLVFWPDEPARGTINANYQESLQNKRDTASIEIEIDSMDNQIATKKLPPPDFVKIDVEAAELDVLAGMQQTLATHRPRLFIEVHSGVDVKSLAQNLIDQGYQLFHVESGTMIDGSNPPVVQNGHLYCEPHELLRRHH